MTPTDEIMNVAAVRRLAGAFAQAGRLLQRISKTLYALMLTLKTTAAVGLIGDELVDRYLTQTRPVLDTLAQRCTATADELRRSAAAYEQGKPAGSTRYY
jgi:hypothetical protein